METGVSSRLTSQAMTLVAISYNETMENYKILKTGNKNSNVGKCKSACIQYQNNNASMQYVPYPSEFHTIMHLNQLAIKHQLYGQPSDDKLH